MFEENNDEEQPVEEDYYAFLNVARDASQQDITNAYRRLSKTYHPDKHTDPDRKKEAEYMFNRTRQVYQVLSDPHKRAIYDSLGVRGLETEGWELVQHTKTPQEIREEYEKLAKEKEEKMQQYLANPRGTVTVNINATDLFNKYDDDYDNSRSFLSSIEVRGMSFTQSIEAPITSKDTITMHGQVGTQNGTGSGTITVSAKRLLAPRGWVEMEMSAGNGPVLSFKGFSTLSRRMFCNGGTIFQFTEYGMKTSLVGTLAMQLDTHTIGYLTYRAGMQGAMNTTIVRSTADTYTALLIHFSIFHSYVGLNHSYKLPDKMLKLYGSVRLGTFGVYVEYGAEKKLSKSNAISAAVRVGMPTGVTLRIKLIRATQTYSFPIQLSEEVLPAPIFYATVVPLVSWAILKKAVIEPIQRERKEREKQKQREANKSRIVERQKEAKIATELMKETVSRIRAEEEGKRGLIITKALYGRFVYPQGQENVPRDEVIDVTIPLQCLVRDSKLVLHTQSKSELPGFYDPCVGEEKKLLVQYLFHNQTHECIVDDTTPLRIPVPSHKVNTT